MFFIPFIFSLGLAAGIVYFIIKYYKPQPKLGLLQAGLYQSAPNTNKTEVKEFLKTMPSLRGCDEGVFDFLALKLKFEKVPKGNIIVMKGDISKEMYFLKEGIVDICTQDGRVVLDQCLPGQIFGELALLYSMPRTATVRAAVNCEVFILYKQDFDSLIEIYPQLLRKVKKVALERFNWFNERLRQSVTEHGAYSEDQIAVFKQVFNDMDLDGNGTIDADELGYMILRLTGRRYSQKEVDELLAKIDTNKNNAIEFDEFLVGLHHLPVLPDFVEKNEKQQKKKEAEGTL